MHDLLVFQGDLLPRAMCRYVCSSVWSVAFVTTAAAVFVVCGIVISVQQHAPAYYTIMLGTIKACCVAGLCICVAVDIVVCVYCGAGAVGPHLALFALHTMHGLTGSLA